MTALRLPGGELTLDEPRIMGILNASPDSFSDPGARSLDGYVRRAEELRERGAAIVDIGGESARTDRAPIGAEEEVERVVPVIEAVAQRVDVALSVDTWKPAVARAAVRAGASIVNDISGLRDEGVAHACAEGGAALVVTHNPGIPKVRAAEPPAYGDVVRHVTAFLADRVAAARAAGVGEERIVVDPGPDLHKTPAQTIALLARLEELHALGRPLLLAVSRKDFVGALTLRSPRARLAGTLAAIDDGVRRGARILRVHDVAEVRAFLTARGYGTAGGG
ncbi:MAG: dihydropteroate synthase [Actinomycetota bacterium]|nr:dihydropteroate synthase [Actinomycetota bacterium]